MGYYVIKKKEEPRKFSYTETVAEYLARGGHITKIDNAQIYAEYERRKKEQNEQR